MVNANVSLSSMMPSTGASGTGHDGSRTVVVVLVDVVLVVVVVGPGGVGGMHAVAASATAMSSVDAATTFDRRRERLNSLVRGSIASPFVCEDPTGTSHRVAATVRVPMGTRAVLSHDPSSRSAVLDGCR
jgi:hypothetical protein